MCCTVLHELLSTLLVYHSSRVDATDEPRRAQIAAHYREYFRSRPSGGGVGVGVVGGDWSTLTPDVREGQRWVQQAEFDLVAVDALYEKTLTDSKISSHVCFMAHEVAEKALKGGMYAVCDLNPVFLANHQVVYLAGETKGAVDTNII